MGRVRFQVRISIWFGMIASAEGEFSLIPCVVIDGVNGVFPV